MGRTASRSSEQTRRALLDAAARCVLLRGPSSSLDEIAAEAGVSKGGLLYHYPTKDSLFLALLLDYGDAFRRDVAEAIEPGDEAPGRLTRAYIRASFKVPTDTARYRDAISLAIQLMVIPQIAELARSDSERWAAELDADGLPPSVVTLVRSAADGASMAPLWGAEIERGRYVELEDRLIALTRSTPAHIA